MKEKHALKNIVQAALIPRHKHRRDGAKMDGGKRERGSRGGKGGSKGGSKRAKAEDGAVTKLRATLSEALAILDWPDATEADLETALGQLGPLMHQLLGLATKKGRSGALDAPTHQKILGAIETGCAHPQPRVCTAAWKAFREVSLLDAELVGVRSWLGLGLGLLNLPLTLTLALALALTRSACWTRSCARWRSSAG